jgi:hypothetical protein
MAHGMRGGDAEGDVTWASHACCPRVELGTRGVSTNAAQSESLVSEDTPRVDLSQCVNDPGRDEWQ